MGDSVLFGVVAVILGLALIPLGRGTLRAWRTLRSLARWRGASRRLRRDGFAELRSGFLALQGRIEPIDPIASSWSDREGVYLAYVTSRWESVPTMAGVTGGQWVVTQRDEVAAPFELSDGRATVLVEPERAAIFAPTATFERSTPARARCVEQLLERHQDVIVIGDVTQVGGLTASGTYRGHGFRTVVRAPVHASLLIATPDQLTGALRGHRASAGLRLLPFLMLCAAAVIAAGNALPWHPVELPPVHRGQPGRSLVGSPFLALRWQREGEAQQLGYGRVRVVTLGWNVAARPRFSSLVRRELERRKAFGIVGQPRRSRWLLIFDVIEVRGPVLRRVR